MIVQHWCWLETVGHYPTLYHILLIYYSLSPQYLTKQAVILFREHPALR